MKTITIRNIKIGEGSPKIIVPIVGKAKKEIIEMAQNLNELKIDLVEWRVDFYDEVFNIEKVIDTLKDLRCILNNKLILFTIRTKKEGGEKDISMEEYTTLNKAVAESGNADLIDVEIFLGDDIVRDNISNIQKTGAIVVGSSHEFYRTPDKDDIVSRLRSMQDLGADILKIAVMPQSPEDVLTLLSATNEMYTKYADRPIVTISMGSMGVISRLSGGVFGSAMTFGAVGQVSAPGQIPVEELSTTLNILHREMQVIG